MVRLAILIASMLIATPAGGGDPVAPGAQPSAERANNRDLRDCLRWVETVHGVELGTRYCRCAFEILDREDVEKRTRAMTEEQERAYYAEIASRCKPPEMVLLPDFVADWHAIQTSAFQASIPCRIEAQEQGVQTAAGLVNHVLWVCQARDRIFALSYGDYPRAYVNGLTPDAIMKSVEDGMLASLGGTTLRELPVRLGSGKSGKEWPGRHIEITTSSFWAQNTRLFLVDNRLYQLTERFLKGSRPSGDFAQMVSSFKLK
jgi:hypothetical protein